MFEKNNCVLEFNQSQWLKLYVVFKNDRIRKKNSDKDGKPLYKLMGNAAHKKIIGNLRNRIDVRLVNNKKDYLKWVKIKLFLTKNI